MTSTIKAFAALAIAGIVLAGAGTASAASVYVKYQPRVTYQGQAPKIVKPTICKNELSRTITGPNGVSYTAKKCG